MRQFCSCTILKHWVNSSTFAELNLTLKLRYFAGCQERSVELAQSFTFVFCYSNFSIFVFTIHSFMFVLYFPFPELLLLEEGRIGKEREK